MDQRGRNVDERGMPTNHDMRSDFEVLLEHLGKRIVTQTWTEDGIRTSKKFIESIVPKEATDRSK